MNPRVKAVQPNVDYTLKIEFGNGEIRVFDVKPYLDKGIFRQLQAIDSFCSVRPFLGSVQWQGAKTFAQIHSI